MALQVLRELERAVGGAQYRAISRAARAYARVRLEVAVFDGVRVPYYRRASRDGRAPVVLVHGFGGDKEGWLLLAGSLGRARGLVIPDLPGHGAADPIPRERASARAQAAAVAAVVAHAGAERAHLVGNSMGGGIALRFAQDYPARAASITLIGSVGPVVERSEVGEAIDRGENPLITRDPDDLERLLRLVAERVPPSTRAMRRYLGTERWKRSAALAELFRGWVEPAAGEGVPTALGALDAPALVIHGDKDRVIHPSTGRALAEGLRRARYAPMASLGHVPQLEDPRGVARELEAFLSSLP